MTATGTATGPHIDTRLTGRSRAAEALADAMDTAEARGEAIPCKDGTNDWIADTLTGRLIRRVVAECLNDCPVLDECRARRDIAAPGELHGVVAGRLIINRGYGLAKTGPRAKITPERALELFTAGMSLKQIAQAHDLSVASIQRHLSTARRNRNRARARTVGEAAA